MSDRLLVAYGTTNDATRRVAEVIADQLRIDGLTVDVAPASDIHAVNGYDAVVLGGAVFHAHWHDDSRRFARRHASALNDRPVWVFSAVSDGDAPSPTPVRGALQAMVRLHARGHASFSTAVQPMRAWADSIARALSASPTATSH
ncbi:MAG: flavodoxin domain-containing protein [Actinomycetes bacterium]